MKKISEIYKQAGNQSPVFSFEFFPPKNDAGEKALYRTVQNLQELKPAYVSVTYGAGGSSRDKTLKWVRTIQEKYGIAAMAHFTCVGADRNDIKASLQSFADNGISNIMALRGDVPRDMPDYQPPQDGFTYANELIAFMRQFEFDFSVGAACYPEVHQEAKSAAADLEYLKQKVEAGVDFLVTQLFFDNLSYFDFVKRCRTAGIEVPIVPGIMPVTAFSQIERFADMAACKIPQDLVADLKSVQHDRDKLLQVSFEYSTRQCQELIKGGAPGIHFYTLNKSKMTRRIVAKLEA